MKGNVKRYWTTDEVDEKLLQYRKEIKILKSGVERMVFQLKSQGKKLDGLQGLVEESFSRLAWTKEDRKRIKKLLN